MQTGPMKNAALNAGQGQMQNQNQNQALSQSALKKGSSYKNKKKIQKDKPVASMSSSSTSSSSAASASRPPGFETVQADKSAIPESQQRLLRHRALFAFRVLVGKAVDVKLVDSSHYSGVLDCIDPDTFAVVLKNAQRKSQSDEPFDNGSTVIFKRLQIVHMSAEGQLNYNESSFVGAAATGGFRTDAEISARQSGHLYGRELQTASSWLDPTLDTGDLEESGRRSSRAGWNQFEANEKLFGVVSTYDENIYTTKLDKSKFSTEQSKQAERIAREIERQVSSNFHLQEERGVATHHDELDEEARYSSVDRTPASRGPNTYVPPALRSNTQRPQNAGKSRPQTPPVSAPAPSKPSPAAKGPQPVQPPATSTFGQGTSFSDAVRGKRPAATQPAPTASSTPRTATAAQTTQPDKVVSPKAKEEEPKSQAKDSPSRTKKKDPAAADGAVTPSTTASATTSPAPSPKKASQSPAKVVSPAKKAAGSPTKSESAVKESSEEKPKTEQTETNEPKPAPKKGLNPNAKEFKLSAAAAEFTPRFATPQYGHKDSNYRGNSGPYHGYGGGAGGFGHHHPAPQPNPMYPIQQEEWMYENGMMMEEGADMPPYGYMQYPGMPMAPNAGMMPSQPMYPVMVPQQSMRVRGDAGYMYHHHHHHQSPYNPRFYPPNGGGMNFPPGGTNQPPLPRDPSPMQEGGVVQGSDTSSPSHEVAMPSSRDQSEASATATAPVVATNTAATTTSEAPVKIE